MLLAISLDRKSYEVIEFMYCLDSKCVPAEGCYFQFSKYFRVKANRHESGITLAIILSKSQFWKVCSEFTSFQVQDRPRTSKQRHCGADAHRNRDTAEQRCAATCSRPADSSARLAGMAPKFECVKQKQSFLARVQSMYCCFQQPRQF